MNQRFFIRITLIFLLLIAVALISGCIVFTEDVYYLMYPHVSSGSSFTDYTTKMLPEGEVELGTVLGENLVQILPWHSIIGLYCELFFCWPKPILIRATPMTFRIYPVIDSVIQVGECLFERTVMVSCNEIGEADVMIHLPEPIPMMNNRYLLTVSYDNGSPFVNPRLSAIDAPNGRLYRVDGGSWLQHDAKVAWRFALRINRNIMP